MPLIPVRGRQRQVELYEFEASLVSGRSSRTARTRQRNPVLKNKTQTNKTKQTTELRTTV